MKSDIMIKQIQKWSFDYIKMECSGDKCYGVLAVRNPNTFTLFSADSIPQVHRICFALALLHFLLSTSLIGVKDTRDKRAALQNG